MNSSSSEKSTISQNDLDLLYALRILIGMKMRKNDIIKKYAEKLKESKNQQWELFIDLSINHKEIALDTFTNVKFNLFGIGCFIILSKITNEHKIKEIVTKLIDQNKAQINQTHPEWKDFSALQFEHTNSTFTKLLSYLK